MTSTADWEAFDPGFEHGEVELRRSNIDGVFSASKISAAGLVLAPNVTGQISTGTSWALERACPTAQQNETIRTSGQALNDKSTVVLSQDMNALAGTFCFR